jgi:hypothetical protein
VSKILPFAKVDAFDPELIRVMSKGFELAWTALCDRNALASNAIATREIVARRIVHVAKQGVKDPFRLSGEAITVILASEFRRARHRSTAKTGWVERTTTSGVPTDSANLPISAGDLPSFLPRESSNECP